MSTEQNVETTYQVRHGLVIRFRHDNDGVHSVTIESERPLRATDLRKMDWIAAFANGIGTDPFLIVPVPDRRKDPDGWDDAVVTVVRQAVLHEVSVAEAVAERLGTTRNYANRIIQSLRRRGKIGTISEEKQEYGKARHRTSLNEFSSEFRRIRDDPRRTESVRAVLARRFGMPLWQVSEMTRAAMDVGLLEERDKIVKGRPRTQPPARN